MPLFEYRCRDCGARFTQLVGMTADSHEPVCARCGSRNADKLISRFSRRRSEDEKLNSLESAAMAAGDDPSGTSSFMREMGRELSDDGDAGDIDELVDEAEREKYNEPQGIIDTPSNG